MRIAFAELALLVLGAPICAAGQVPEPLFWETEGDFVDEVEEGQFNDHLELHLVQYASEPGWRLEWAAAQYAASGLFGEYGSIATKELYVDSQIALNVFPAEWLQIRYDRRDWRDGRFDRSSQRLDAVFQIGSSWGVVLSGWPTFEKEHSSLGGGLRLGARRSPNMLELRVLDERWIWNDKSSGEVRFARHPIRVLLDASGAAGPWRTRASVDWGLPYRAVERGPGARRRTAGLQGSVDVEAQYAAATWSATARLTGARRERRQSGSTAPTWSLDRSWARAVVSLRKDLGRWSIAALAGWASQREAFAEPEDPAGRYRADVLLAGIEGGWMPAEQVQLRLGYLASALDARREVSGAGALPARSQREILDKAHLRALYAFGPRMSIEFLLSQTLHGNQFGGGSVKALFAF